MGRSIVLVDRAPRGDQRLGQHLAAENPSRTDVPVATAIDVSLDRFEFEQRDQVFYRVGHGLEGLGQREDVLARVTIDR